MAKNHFRSRTVFHSIVVTSKNQQAGNGESWHPAQGSKTNFSTFAKKRVSKCGSPNFIMGKHLMEVNPLEET